MKYFFYILILLTLVACGKKNQIKATAKNAATGEGYSGLGFRVYKIKPYQGPTGEIQDLVYEGTFNQNGEAIAEMRIRKNLSYVIKTESPGSIHNTPLAQAMTT